MARSYRLGAAFARLSKVAATLSATAGIVTFGSAPLFAAAGKQESVAVATRSLVSLKWIQQAPGAAMAARISSDVRATAASHAEIAVRMASDRSLFEAFASKDRLGSTLLKKLLADFDALEASRTASHEERARLLELLGASLATRSSGSGVETMFSVNGRPRLRVFESAAPRHSSRVESPDGASDSPSAEPAWKDEVDDAMKLAGIKPGPVCATHVNDDTGAAREVHAVHQVAAMRTAQVTDRAERDRSAHRNP